MISVSDKVTPVDKQSNEEGNKDKENAPTIPVYDRTSRAGCVLQLLGASPDFDIHQGRQTRNKSYTIDVMMGEYVFSTTSASEQYEKSEYGIKHPLKEENVPATASTTLAKGTEEEKMIDQSTY
jgi:hypothetical protein